MFVWLAVAWLQAHDDYPAGGMAGASGELPPLLASIVNGVLVNVLFFGFAYLFGETAWLAARRQHQFGGTGRRAAGSPGVDRPGKRSWASGCVSPASSTTSSPTTYSVMGIQAAASRRAFDRNPDLARAALAAIERCSRTAVDELRRMLGALRAADHPVTESTLPPHQRTVDSPAGIEQVAELVESAKVAGLDSRLGVHGTPRRGA